MSNNIPLIHFVEFDSLEDILKQPQIPNANFHKVAVQRKAQKYYDKLMANPLEIAKQTYEIEIIPYEDLWEFALDSLGHKLHIVKSKF